MLTRAWRLTVRIIERLNEIVGQLAAWLVVALVSLTLFDVAMRYLFRDGSVAAQEMEWHLFAMIFLLGAGYTLKHDAHVRVDLFYASQRFSDRHRALVDLGGNVLFLLPFSLLVIWSSLPFVTSAYVGAEISPDPGGLHYRWLIKACIPCGFILLSLQSVAAAWRCIERLSSTADT